MTPSSHPAPTDDLLELTAELRAEGHGWEHVALQLHHPSTELHARARANPKRYQQLLKRARFDVFGEAVSEAIQFLRKLMRSPDEKTCHDASMCMVKTWGTVIRHQPKGKYSRVAHSDPFLEDISHEEVEALVHELYSDPGQSDPPPDSEARTNPTIVLPLLRTADHGQTRHPAHRRTLTGQNGCCTPNQN